MRVVRGNPTPEELAAALAVVRGCAPAPCRPTSRGGRRPAPGRIRPVRCPARPRRRVRRPGAAPSGPADRPRCRPAGRARPRVCCACARA
ncbi:acyl-CoA carboxylase subunit epsilon [Streptomyces sp. GKU 257-1]|nr:acyl-CoA carboxylase subunit epsilon [Streptomyces sp. GKU 257-1]